MGILSFWKATGQLVLRTINKTSETDLRFEFILFVFDASSEERSHYPCFACLRTADRQKS